MRIAIIATITMINITAYAHDGDPAHDRWYESLTRPDFPGQSCCSLQDCKPVDYRINKDGHYEVFIDPHVFTYNNEGAVGGWITVPDARVIHDKKVLQSNPFGRGVACWMPQLGVICFVPAGGV